MTKQPKKDEGKKPDRSKTPRIEKVTLKDLDADSAGQDVKGGRLPRTGACTTGRVGDRA